MLSIGGVAMNLVQPCPVKVMVCWGEDILV